MSPSPTLNATLSSAILFFSRRLSARHSWTCSRLRLPSRFQQASSTRCGYRAAFADKAMKTAQLRRPSYIVLLLAVRRSTTTLQISVKRQRRSAFSLSPRLEHAAMYRSRSKVDPPRRSLLRVESSRPLAPRSVSVQSDSGFGIGRTCAIRASIRGWASCCCRLEASLRRCHGEQVQPNRLRDLAILSAGLSR